jgi:two-component system cell cycle sensor histidine kinase/response regulator CckA
MLYMRDEGGFSGKTEKPVRVLLAGGPLAGNHALARWLAQHGYAVAAALPAEESAAIVDQAPDLAIVLADLAEVDSFEVCRGLRADESTESVPVLLVCDRDTRVDWLEGMPGVFDVIREPYREDDLLARVRMLLKLKHLDDDVHNLQRQLYTSQKMECVGALTAGVAHEFNNLMCAVMGFAEMAKADGGTDLAALRESAEISYETAQRAAATAATILAFSRGKTDQKTVGSVNDVVWDAVRLLQKNMASAGITLRMDLGELPPTQFSAGPLQQVFLNLIINAWHAMLEATGERLVTVTTRCEHESRISISVRDTGVGIAVADQERIFTPFYTTKKGGAGSVAGSGLGLPLVLRVVKDHGGTVQLDSAPGKGACFTVLLPVQGQTAAGSGTSPSALSIRKRSVLIVDDEEGSRRVLMRLLLKRGHDCCAVASMAEAMSILLGRKFDLIVMDLILPESDGVTNIQRLREEGIATPILICTGQMDGDAIERGLQAGASGVVHKPFSAARFIATMNECLG